MDVPTEPIHLDVRRAWDGAAWLYLVGPGAAGKSTLGRSLALRLNRSLIDLDEAFMQRIGQIGEFIRAQGYETYKRANSELAHNLAAEAADPAILVTSSGFLALDNPPEVLVANCALVRKGYCLSLLPALDLESAVAILVDRQMARPFNGGVSKEKATARARFKTYRSAGDCLVCTVADPEAVTEALVRRLIDGNSHNPLPDLLQNPVSLASDLRASRPNAHSENKGATPPSVHRPAVGLCATEGLRARPPPDPKRR